MTSQWKKNTVHEQSTHKGSNVFAFYILNSLITKVMKIKTTRRLIISRVISVVKWEPGKDLLLLLLLNRFSRV